MSIDEDLLTAPPRRGGPARVSALDRLVLAELRLLDRPRRPTRPVPASPSPLTPEPAPHEPDEDAVIVRTAAWLASRPNPYVLIDAIWARTRANVSAAGMPAAPSAPAGTPDPSASADEAAP